MSDSYSSKPDHSQEQKYLNNETLIETLFLKQHITINVFDMIATCFRILACTKGSVTCLSLSDS